MRGLYLVTDRGLCGERNLEDVVGQTVRGGVACVQLREKDLPTGLFVAQAKKIKEILLPLRVPLIINDRVDVALAVGADGVHVGQDDMPYELARKLMGPGAVIGVSVETWEDVEKAQCLDVDYLGVSPIFETPTKTDTKGAWGLAGLARIRAYSRHSLVAIGGMNRENAAAAVQAGADGIAVVSALCCAADPMSAARELTAMIEGRSERGKSVPIRLIVFDFSGTLSIEAVRFAAPVRLLEELERSGLAALGVATPAFFWNEIVNPTWHEGSTTAVSYQKVLEKRIGEIFHHEPILATSAVSRFVHAYFEASRIDPRWRPVLARLAADPAVKTVIASDHYAEATDAIRRFLEDIEITAVSPWADRRQPQPGPFLIATSADIGFHKATEPFWTAVKACIEPETVTHILLVDDFGVHEQEGDSYALKGKALSRRLETEAILKKVFSVEVTVFPFMAKDRGPYGMADDDALGELMDRAAGSIDRFLET